MRILRLFAILSLAVGGLSPVFAANETKETWVANWGNKSCKLILTYDSADLAGKVETLNPCAKPMRKARSFVYADDARNHMILFSRPGAKGAILGSFDRAGENNMQGDIGTGSMVSLFLSSSTSVTVNSSVSVGSDSGSEDCVRYAHNQSCARFSDLKNPKIETFKTIEMTSLANQDIFPFSGGGGFAKDESAVRGACMTVKKCEQAFNSSEMWCEVVLSDGFFTGWVKRMDDDFVYLRKGC